MDLTNTLNRLVELAVEAAGPTVTDYSTSHLQSVKPNGEISFVAKPLKPPTHHARDLRSIVDRLRRTAEQIDPELTPQSSIWIDRENVVALYWDNDVRASIRCPLPFSDVYLMLCAIDGKSLNQRDAVDFFYFTLGEYVPTELPDLLRSINFTLESAENKSLQRDRESLGASVTKTLTAATAIPKWVNVTIPIYRLDPELDTDQEFTIYLTPNVDQRTIQLRLAPDNIHRAENAAQELLRAWFTHESTAEVVGPDGAPNNRSISRVYRGRPY